MNNISGVIVHYSEIFRTAIFVHFSVDVFWVKTSNFTTIFSPKNINKIKKLIPSHFFLQKCFQNHNIDSREGHVGLYFKVHKTLMTAVLRSIVEWLVAECQTAERNTVKMSNSFDPSWQPPVGVRYSSW
jgi:hypothetical protein